MTLLEKHQKFVLDAVRKQFEVIGAKYSPTLPIKGYAWDRYQKEEFRQWFLKEFIRRFKVKEWSVRKEWEWWNLKYGWNMEGEDND